MTKKSSPASASQRTTPSDAYEAESWLDELARFLKDQNYDLATWLATAIERRQSSNASLERELGLLRTGVGAPPIKDRPRSDPERRRRVHIALDAHRHVIDLPPGKKVPWKKIAAEIKFKGTSNELRKLYGEFYDEAEDVARQLAQELASGAKNG